MPDDAAAAVSLTAGLLHDADSDEWEEAEFDPDVSSSDAASSDDEEGAADQDYAVLSGSVYLNDEGRVICAGTWCLNSEREQLPPSRSNGKRSKFKWKSQASYSLPSAEVVVGGNGRALFDVRRPTLVQIPSATGGPPAAPPTRRTVIFNGFFVEPTGGNKIKERDVELFFTTGHAESTASTQDPASSTAVAAVEYRISGRGSNDYGPFVIEGTYAPPAKTEDDAPKKEDDNRGQGEDAEQRHDKHRGKGPTAAVLCRKTYGAGGANKTTRSGATRASRRGRYADDDSADGDFGDEKADYIEVAELHEDAALSVEELRRKYYGTGGEGDGGGKPGSAKRPRLEDSDNDCGF